MYFAPIKINTDFWLVQHIRHLCKLSFHPTINKKAEQMKDQQLILDLKEFTGQWLLPKLQRQANTEKDKYTKNEPTADTFAGISVKINLNYTWWWTARGLTISLRETPGGTQSWGEGISHTSVSFTSKSPTTFYLRKMPLLERERQPF